MNQDQARRWAEEVELPEPVGSIHEDGYWLRADNSVGRSVSAAMHSTGPYRQTVYTESQVREAIAATLVKLYTHPTQPAREWVGLTDEEREMMANLPQCRCGFDRETLDWHMYSHAVESKLREKNAGQPVKEN